MVNYSQSLVPLLFLQHNILKYAEHWIEFHIGQQALNVSSILSWRGAGSGEAGGFTVDGHSTNSRVRSFLHHHVIHSCIHSRESLS